MAVTARPVVWLHGEVKSPPFSLAARIETGLLLRRLQSGEKLPLPHSRPMAAIGPRCHELRIPDQAVTWRIVYRLDADAVVITEVFSKKTRTTPRHVVQICRRRLWVYDALANLARERP